MSEFVYIGMCGTPALHTGGGGCAASCKRIAHGTPARIMHASPAHHERGDCLNAPISP